jgi:hypothetical protein
MKNVVIFLFGAVLLTSCGKDDAARNPQTGIKVKRIFFTVNEVGQYNLSDTLNFTYDSLGRVTRSYFDLVVDTNNILYKHDRRFFYNGSSNKPIKLVKQVVINYSGGYAQISKKTINYTYDGNDRVIQELNNDIEYGVNGSSYINAKKNVYTYLGTRSYLHTTFYGNYDTTTQNYVFPQNPHSVDSILIDAQDRIIGMRTQGNYKYANVVYDAGTSVEGLFNYGKYLFDSESFDSNEGNWTLSSNPSKFNFYSNSTNKLEEKRFTYRFDASGLPLEIVKSEFENGVSINRVTKYLYRYELF